VARKLAETETSPNAIAAIESYVRELGMQIKALESTNPAEH